jgi:hypothetical protein
MRRLLPVAVFTSASLVGLSAAAHSHAASIQGVWRTAEVKVTGPNAATFTQPPSLGIITAKYYSRVEIHGDPRRPSLPDAAKATADELRAAWGPFFAEAGTYELSGANGLTMRPLITKNPAAMNSGWFLTYTYRMQGDTLWLTEQRNQRGPIATPTTIKLIRVE